ncbi:MFS transporter [Bacillus marinisedimentorum]|uniref:MFS transporter n=1 Tax=Bacillus marinisedimentorum TaxID=1821260 RepID=UPI0007DE9060|nr:MFS transporter [Bacillus marinisedimentorum]
MSATSAKSKPIEQEKPQATVYNILFIIGFVHLLNDSIQSVIPAMFPILEKSMGLTFTQLGLIAFSLNMVSSVMQPAVGYFADKRPMPYALPIGLASSMIGILALALAPSFGIILISVIFIGLGSAVFHPEGSRVAYMAAGPRRGLAQSIYQVGGNSGQALAPVITALILVPLGQFGAIWFTFIAAIAVILLMYIARWYSSRLVETTLKRAGNQAAANGSAVTRPIAYALIVLVFLVFARTWYGSAISNFYAFYVMDSYGASIRESQSYIFLFLVMGAVGTFIGGPLADRFGKRTIILLSFAAAAPLALFLPYAGPVLAYGLLAFIGLIMMSSFSVTVVYAQELLPGKIGMMSGLIVGLAFGMGAIGSVVLGSFIDAFGLTPTMATVAFLPLLGLLTFLLPTDEKVSEWHA